MLLSFSTKGSVVIIKAIKGKDETRNFVENLGFVVGQNVTVVTELGGSLIVNVREIRVAISKSMASRILI